MGLFKRGKIWWMSWTDRAGRQKRESCNTSNKREAIEVQQTRQAEIRFGRAPIARANAPRLDAWCEEHLQSVENENTRDRYRASLHHFLDFIGPVRVSDISALDIYRFLQKLGKDGVSPATRNRDRSAVSGMLNRAAKLGFLARNPCSDVEPFDERQARREARPFTYEEEGRLLSVCSPLLKIFATVLIETGLRARKEALSLLWVDVDIESSPGSIIVRQSKTAAGRRRIWLTEYCRMELMHWRDLLGAGFSPFVFPSLRDPRRHWTYYQDAWEAAIKAAGLPGRRAHDLRATFASRANACQASGLTVAHLLGNASTQVLPSYVKPLDENMKTVITALDAARASQGTRCVPIQ